MIAINRLTPYMHLMRFHRPVGLFLLLWPTLIALAMASPGKPGLKNLLIFTIGVVVMRAAGCVINDFADRNVDGYVARTKSRPLVTKKVTEASAIHLFSVLVLIALILDLQLSQYTIKLSTIALGLAIVYPFFKRFSGYPQFVLGVAFSWSIPMVYAEVQGYLSAETWVLFASTLCWVIAYDTQYGMVDKEYDLRIGIKSTAITFGEYDKMNIFILQLLSLVGFMVLGILKSVDAIYYICLSIALLLAVYQQWLIKDRDPDKCFVAFLNNNYFGAVICLGAYLC